MGRRIVESPTVRVVGAPFGVIYADPPWSYRDKAHAGERGVEHKYNLMSTEEIAGLDVQGVAADDAILCLWATPPLIDDARRVIDAWGFQYKTFGFVWIKLSGESGLLHWGMGNWTRANVEPCLLATRGDPRRFSAGVHQVVVHPVDPILHSRKPAEVRRRVEMLADDTSRLELFATERVPGWTTIGYKADGRDVREVLGYRPDFSEKK